MCHVIKGTGAARAVRTFLGLALCAGAWLAAPPAARAQAACSQSFAPGKLAAGEDCTPVYHQYCPRLTDDRASYKEPIGSCEGVRAAQGQARSGDLVSDYVLLWPEHPSGPIETLYLALHWKGANANVAANAQRLHELVKSRNVAVVLPNAPETVWPASNLGANLSPLVSPLDGKTLHLPELSLPRLPPNLPAPLETLQSISDRLKLGLSLPVAGPDGTLVIPEIRLPRLPIDFRDSIGVLPVLDPLLPIQPFVDLLDAVVAEAAVQLDLDHPELMVTGLSNGGQMAWYYACRSAQEVDAIMVVGASLSRSEMRSCVARGRSFGVVQVHGSSDYLVPYRGTLFGVSIPLAFETFADNNGCLDASLGHSSRPPLRGELMIRDIDFRWYDRCTSGRRSYLVTVRRGGHGWPGFDYYSPAQVRTLGFSTRAFDATLQGYDLMRLAADARR